MSLQQYLSKLSMELGEVKLEPAKTAYKIAVLNPGSTSTKLGLQTELGFLTQDIIFHEKRSENQDDRKKQDVEIARMWLG